MVTGPEFDYKKLKEVRSFKEIPCFKLRVSAAQAAALQKYERQVDKFQLSEALDDNVNRNIIMALPAMLSEMWGSIRYPNLSTVRGLFVAGEVESVDYERVDTGEVVVHFTLRKGAS